MAPKSKFESDNSDNYERVELEEIEDGHGRKSAEDGDIRTSARLPAKALPPRRSLLPFAIAGLGAFISILGLIFLLHYLPHLKPDASTSRYIGKDGVSCDLTKPTDSHVENAFMINLRSAQHLSFSEAKMIDVIWDLFVGQGGRLLMAWVAYQVFMDGLVSLMEDTPVSYGLYTSLVFETTSLLTTWKATSAIIKSRSWRGRVFMFWFCLATFYILSFPTLMGAATGYVNPSSPGYILGDGNLVMASASNLTSCISLDNGEMIKERNGTIVQGPQALIEPLYSSKTLPLDIAKIYPGYDDYWYLRLYVQDYSYYDNRNYSNTTYSDYGNYTSNFTWHGRPYTYNNTDFSPEYFREYYCYDGKWISGNLDDLSQCMPDDYFVWGFSSLLLQVILYLQIIWTFVMLFIWLHANMTSQLLFKSRKVRGNYRAASDLAEAMRDVLGDECCAYSDNEIARELKRQRAGLRYCTTDNHEKGIAHIGLGCHGSLGLDNSKLYGFRQRRGTATRAPSVS